MKIIGVLSVLFLAFFIPRTLAQTVEESHFGFLGPGDPSYNPNYYTEYNELGVFIDRPHPGPFIWEIVESEQGVYNWSKIDSLVLSAQQANISMLATIWPYAEWDQQYWRDQAFWESSGGFEKDLPKSRYKPNDSTAYKSFVTAMVERYDGDGTDDMPNLTLPIVYWEILNEPESSDWEDLNFFKGNERDYFDVLRWTFEAIKEANSAAIVLQGGSTGVENEYWQEVFNLGGTEYFQISNTHAITPPSQITDLRANQWANLISNYDIDQYWITEVEIAKNGAESYTQREVGEQIIKQYARAFAAGADKIFYAHIYGDSDTPDFLEAALIEVLDYENWTEQRREAYYSLKTLIDKIDYFDHVEIIEETKLKFTVGSEVVYILWGGGAVPGEIQGSVSITDYQGNVSQMNASEIQLNATPIFVESNITSSNEQLDQPFQLNLSAYPNPFNPSTNLVFTIPKSGVVSITIYNVMGQKITTLLNEYRTSGEHSITFNANNLPSGIYLYQLSSHGITMSGRITLLK